MMRFFLFACCLILASCGFTPVYKKNSVLQEALTEIEIAPIEGREGQLMRAHLQDALQPEGAVAKPRYHLEITMVESKVPLAIQQDATVTRYRMSIIAKYRLKDIESGKPIELSKIQRQGGFDKVVSEYATYAAERSTREHLIRTLANDLRMRLGFVLSRHRAQ